MQEATSRRFSPLRDLDATAAILATWPGLRSEHRELWPLLCQVCGHERSGSISQNELAEMLRQVRGKPVDGSQVIRRLRTMQDRRLLVWRRNGDGTLWICLHNPLRAQRPVIVSRRPLRATAGGDRQRELFPSVPTLRVFRPSSEATEVQAVALCPEAQPLALRGTEVPALRGPEVQALSGFEVQAVVLPPPVPDPAGETPRAPARPSYERTSSSFVNNDDDVRTKAETETACTSTPAWPDVWEHAVRELKPKLGKPRTVGERIDGLKIAYASLTGLCTREQLGYAIELARRGPPERRYGYAKGTLRNLVGPLLYAVLDPLTERIPAQLLRPRPRGAPSGDPP